jgi:hypothetical protein
MQMFGCLVLIKKLSVTGTEQYNERTLEGQHGLDTEGQPVLRIRN